MDAERRGHSDLVDPARSLAASIASVLTIPYTALVGIFIYLDLRVRKERDSAADLERDLDRAGSA